MNKEKEIGEIKRLYYEAQCDMLRNENDLSLHGMYYAKRMAYSNVLKLLGMTEYEKQQFLNECNAQIEKEKKTNEGDKNESKISN